MIKQDKTRCVTKWIQYLLLFEIGSIASHKEGMTKHSSEHKIGLINTGRMQCNASEVSTKYSLTASQL